MKGYRQKKLRIRNEIKKKKKNSRREHLSTLIDSKLIGKSKVKSKKF